MLLINIIDKKIGSEKLNEKNCKITSYFNFN